MSQKKPGDAPQKNELAVKRANPATKMFFFPITSPRRPKGIKNPVTASR
jgi:hypothetical protein